MFWACGLGDMARAQDIMIMYNYYMPMAYYYVADIERQKPISNLS